MGIIQTSEKLIRSKFPTLDVYQNKKLSHFESDLFINDDIVYKIFNQSYRLYRQSYLWILDNKKYPNCLNIENQLYQGDKLIGCTTEYQPSFKSMAEVLKSRKFDYYEAKQLLDIIINNINILAADKLIYIDSTIYNIGFNNDKLIMLDIDGVDYITNKVDYVNYLNAAYLNAYYVYFTLILEENLVEVIPSDFYDNVLNIKNFKTKLDLIRTIVNSMNKNIYDEINFKYNNYKKNKLIR